ncbi:MAG: tRNA-(ms[2]io[6]A)-hydroxylase [Pirellulales bacterium]
MLNLASDTSDRWWNLVRDDLPTLLVDHAHCEKKAAGVAMNLLFSYVDRVDACREFAEIVREELEHFEMVLDLLAKRKIQFRKLPPSSYGAKLHELIRKGEPEKAVDRLLVAGLIEARSCERFDLLRQRVEDRELADFYGSLFESEARHHTTYVRIAKAFADEETVVARLKELSAAETRITAELEPLPRMHS